MAELPHPWGAYAHLQELSRRPDVDDRAWGYEVGLNLILVANSTGKYPCQDEIDRAVASGARLDRYRTRLRGRYLQEESAYHGNGVEAFEAREVLQHIQDSLPYSDWALLWELALGREYSEIAQERGITAGSLRARVLRLRRNLVDRVLEGAAPGRDAAKEVSRWQ